MNGPDQQALGIVETRGLVAAVEAADAMLKTASVRLVRIEKTVPALMAVQILGETAAVRAAVDAGQRAAERVGTVVSVHVIPRPADETARMQRLSEAAPGAPSPPPTRGRRSASSAGPGPKPGPKPAAGASAASGLDAMTVRELRALARRTPGMPIQGRAIARASKSELLDAFRSRGG